MNMPSTLHYFKARNMSFYKCK